MRAVNGGLLLLFLLAILALSGCTHVQFPDMRLYSVAGDLQAGADYVYTGHDEQGEVGMKELIDLLEDGAIIMSSEDFKRNKTATEQACIALGNQCSFEIRQALEDFNQRTYPLTNRIE